jgi:hypothetical protein
MEVCQAQFETNEYLLRWLWNFTVRSTCAENEMWRWQLATWSGSRYLKYFRFWFIKHLKFWIQESVDIHTLKHIYTLVYFCHLKLFLLMKQSRHHWIEQEPGNIFKNCRLNTLCFVACMQSCRPKWYRQRMLWEKIVMANLKACSLFKCSNLVNKTKRWKYL